ncbi:MAG: hypothetical protein AVDCRST_MAG30-1923, partial [uncultured Solirubrobacteraceae bacterium]
DRQGPPDRYRRAAPGPAERRPGVRHPHVQRRLRQGAPGRRPDLRDVVPSHGPDRARDAADDRRAHPACARAGSRIGDVALRAGGRRRGRRRLRARPHRPRRNEASPRADPQRAAGRQHPAGLRSRPPRGAHGRGRAGRGRVPRLLPRRGVRRDRHRGRRARRASLHADRHGDGRGRWRRRPLDALPDEGLRGRGAGVLLGYGRPGRPLGGRADLPDDRPRGRPAPGVQAQSGLLRLRALPDPGTPGRGPPLPHHLRGRRRRHVRSAARHAPDPRRHRVVPPRPRVARVLGRRAVDRHDVRAVRGVLGRRRVLRARHGREGRARDEHGDGHPTAARQRRRRLRLERRPDPAGRADRPAPQLRRRRGRRALGDRHRGSAARHRRHAGGDAGPLRLRGHHRPLHPPDRVHRRRPRRGDDLGRARVRDGPHRGRVRGCGGRAGAGAPTDPAGSGPRSGAVARPGAGPDPAGRHPDPVHPVAEPAGPAVVLRMARRSHPAARRPRLPRPRPASRPLPGGPGAPAARHPGRQARAPTRRGPDLLRGPSARRPPAARADLRAALHRSREPRRPLRRSQQQPRGREAGPRGAHHAPPHRVRPPRGSRHRRPHRVRRVRVPPQRAPARSDL